MHKQFLTYVDGKSFLHKLDPRTKIIALMTLSLVIFNTDRTWSLISFLLLFIAVTSIARVSIKKLVLSVKPMLFFIVIIFLLHFIFMPAAVFSDVTMSVKLMDDRLNQLDDRFHVTENYREVYRLQYFVFPSQDGVEEVDVVINSLLLDSSDPDMQDTHSETGYVLIERVQFDEIPEEKLREFSIDSAAIPDKRVYLGKPLIYRLHVAPDKSFFLYLSTYSFITGLCVALKFILLILFSSLMAATTKQSALVQGIERIVRPIPLKWANMTSHDLALMVFLTIRFIPFLTSVSSQIKASSRSRAFNPSKRPFCAIKIISTALTHSIVNFADDVSRAMLSRGYTGVGKTSMDELKFRERDLFFFCSFILVMLSVIMFVSRLQLFISVGI